MECIVTNNEEKMFHTFFEKTASYRKEVMDYKNNANYIMYGFADAKHHKESVDIAELINNLICSLDNLEEAVSSEVFLFDETNLAILLNFSAKHMRFTVKQLTDILFYLMKRNFSQKSFEFTKKSFREAHLKLKKYYFDKQKQDGSVDLLTEEDLLEMKIALQELGINRKIIDKIIKNITLETKTKKLEIDNSEQTKKFKNAIYKKAKVKNNENTPNITTGLFKTKAPEPIISKKDYYRINNELLEYFSFDFETSSLEKINNSIIVNKVLYDDERAKCIDLLKMAKYDISTIKAFLEKSFIFNRSNMNVLSFYNEIYDILNGLLKENILDYYWLEEKLRDISDAILEMQISDTDTYCFCIELIRSIVDDILDNIPTKCGTSCYLKKAKILDK